MCVVLNHHQCSYYLVLFANVKVIYVSPCRVLPVSGAAFGVRLIL